MTNCTAQLGEDSSFMANAGYLSFLLGYNSTGAEAADVLRDAQSSLLKTGKWGWVVTAVQKTMSLTAFV